MPCTKSGNMIICTSPDVKLVVENEVVYFCMHRYCGPMLTDSEWEPILDDAFYKEDNPFWEIFEKWMDNGQKIDSDGFGIIGEE